VLVLPFQVIIELIRMVIKACIRSGIFVNVFNALFRIFRTTIIL
jgi:hypothetical protein